MLYISLFFCIFRYNSVSGLESLLLEMSDSLDSLRESLLQEMDKLETMDSQALVNEAVECHLRTMPTLDEAGPSKKKKKWYDFFFYVEPGCGVEN